MLVKMMLLNDHFHDNDMVYIYNGKVFSSVDSLAKYLGGEYMDFDSLCWESIKVEHEGTVISGREMLDME
nr:MAG TPA: hypothetical protein [Caudoviricetes sp.]